MIGEKNIMVAEYVKNGSGVVIRAYKRELLNIRKDIELGERTVHAYKNLIHYSIYAHKNIDKSITFYIYFYIVKNDIMETFRLINKHTAVNMLSKMNNIYENRIEDYIPDFELEKEKIQLKDRVNDGLTDKEILGQINTVQEFHYFGEAGYCGKPYPHLPHVISYYDTVRYGKLPLFCLGKSGFLMLENGKRVQIVITKSCNENCSGRYVILELLGDE